ncbi:arabinosyltransferase domain-containing protein [Actinomycetospora lemnae]|uniref:Arabinosyltransferase domain-containing protein n=1 Tax=Actinomycetospora lemnae TaxID=3019891 RepID=A0ABT5SU18_9PSEU|nr:arabinosyltransferase domain-containing protein [Actinomycetospora sp. DW7H6]MDD7966356.1 arabinosyltransferase domain-containing protein [Actinomycetospora sp. DW7H6]
MSTDTRPREEAVAGDVARWPVGRLRVIGRTVAVVAGLVAIVGALVLPFAPVDVSTPEVRWPVDPRDPAPTMLMLTAYEPVGLEVRFSCRAARAAAATPDGVVLATMAPSSRDIDEDALVIRAQGDGVVVRSSGEDLFAGALPAGDCAVVVAGDATAMRVVVDGAVVATSASRLPAPLTPQEFAEEDREEPLPETEPDIEVLTPLPEVDALRTSVPGTPDATADDLSVRLTVDDAFAHTPSALKTALITAIVVALVVGGAAMAGLLLLGRRASRPGTERGPPTARVAAWVRSFRAPRWAVVPRLWDVVVPLVLLAWLFLAPMTDDDGYYGAMAANVPFSGYVTNFYQLYNQGFTPFAWPYYVLSWWQTTAGFGPVVQRIPALVLGIATWAAARVFVARTPLWGRGERAERWAHVAARTVLAAAFLAWWLPYDMGLRPEPVVGFFTVATLAAVAEGLERRRLALLGLGVGLATCGLMAAPTGFIALAPLLVAAPATWRLIRDGSTSWFAVAGRWVVVLAPGAVGSLLGFADGAYRDFVRAQAIFAPIQRAQTWYQEFARWAALLDPGGWFGSYARRTAVLLCLLALVWFLVLVVAARARDLVVPRRLPLAGWSMLLSLVLLLPTPSKPTHHFGAFAGLGAVFLALVLVVGPRLLADLDEDRRVPRPALLAAGLATVLVLALGFHGRAMWPYGWGLGQPAYGDYPSIRGYELDQPLWWTLGLTVTAVVLAVVARLLAPRRQRLALAGAVPVLVCVGLLLVSTWTVGDFVRAADRTSTSWSPQVDAWRDPTSAGCALGGQIDVLDTRGQRALPPAVLPGGEPPVPPLAVDAPDAPDPETRTEPFLPGAVFPGSPPPADLPPDTPVFGSFLVPEAGATADARTGSLTTDWYRLDRGAPDAGLAVAVSGRLDDDVTLRVEYGRETPAGFLPTGGAAVGEDGNSVEWRTVPLLGIAAPPPDADVVRLVADDTSTSIGGWLAFSAPVERTWVPLPAYLPPGGAVGVAWQIQSLFPCIRQPRQQDGITEPAVGAIGYGEDPEAALADWTFNPDRGGLLGHAQREAEVTLLTTRVRDVGEDIDDVHVWRYTQPYPTDGYELLRDRTTVPGLP